LTFCPRDGIIQRSVSAGLGSGLGRRFWRGDERLIPDERQSSSEAGTEKNRVFSLAMRAASTLWLVRGSRPMFEDEDRRTLPAAASMEDARSLAGSGLRG